MKAQSQFDFDLIVIGAGSGGYAAAAHAAGAGLKTALIEGGEKVGGLCILRGCMPTKALLYGAEVMHRISHADPWGIRAENVTIDFAKLMARKGALVREFAEYRAGQIERGKFEFIRAAAEFIDPHSVRLRRRGGSSTPLDSSAETVSAAHYIIATGSVVAPAPLEQLNEVGFLDSDSALELQTLPESLIILGGGAIALEFAQFFARFGVHVSLIQRSPHVLHEFDTRVAIVIEEVLRKEGVKVFTGTKLLAARTADEAKGVSFLHDGRTIELAAEQIFYALGRVPNIGGLGLERANVGVERGWIVTDAQMRTTSPHIFAAGDCTGPHEIVHLAIQQGETAAHNAANPGNPKLMDYRLLTEVVFTDPQIASVGLTEKRARALGVPHRSATYDFAEHGKSIMMEERDGFVQLLADPLSGEITGGCCVGPAGGELIHEIIAAMQKRMTVHELAAMPHYHPTLAEIWTYPAEELALTIERARRK